MHSFSGKKEAGNCMVTGKPSSQRVLFAKAINFFKKV